MVMLCAAGLLEKTQGRHENAADVERFLVQGKPGYMGPWITFTKPQWNEWGRLGEHMRNKDLKVMGAIETFTAADARRYHNATYSIGMGAGRRFVRQVDLKGRKRIMDIGGGSGAYCIAAAKEHAGIRAVVLDLPVVCEITREFTRENGVADRVVAQPCDFTRDPFPLDCDVAIMASNLPMYSREVIAGVIKKAHDALLPGGEMHLIGETTNDERTGPWGPAYWGLGQAVGTRWVLLTRRLTSPATSARPASRAWRCTSSFLARSPGLPAARREVVERKLTCRGGLRRGLGLSRETSCHPRRPMSRFAILAVGFLVLFVGGGARFSPSAWP